MGNPFADAAKALNELPLRARNLVAVHVKDEMNVLLDEQFEHGIDPAGDPWTPLAGSTLRRGRRPPPLTDTRAMRDHTRAVRQGTNVEIDAAFPAQVHQRGTRTIPQRQMWPDEGEELPERWELRISLAANEGLHEALGGSGLQAAE